ncbi:2-methylcitrate synthase [Mycobacterium pseudokansasii]|uniref:citrate synthase (unknown stereospecificity) n=1 Tax=Mycobacterium pseudokansasii TaxID=2341080 RepID=A0A498QPA1_9MYCO|nr:2-methylcitrate synthase [Mycobacterium pseudokansasii]
MEQALTRVAAGRDGQRGLDIYHALERDMLAATGVKPDRDFPTGPACHLMGFDIGCLTTVFVMIGIVGWTAHVMEQTASNALILPLSAYIGPPQRPLTTTLA